MIDQLEEAFTPEVTDSATFLRRIASCRNEHPDLALAMTVRADFYPQLMVSPLWELVAPNRVDVTPLSGPALKTAIREPAARVGAVIDEALVAQLANETEGQPGLMPFLQETMRAIWDATRGSTSVPTAGKGLRPTPSLACARRSAGTPTMRWS